MGSWKWTSPKARPERPRRGFEGGVTVGKASYLGSPYLGVYFRVGEERALIPPSCPPALEHLLETTLGVSTLRTTICDTEVVGALVAMNGRGLVLSESVDLDERGRLQSSLEVVVLRSKLNALGNTILANDRGAVVHPEFTSAQRRLIRDAMGVPVVASTVAGLGTVAKAAVATNRGVVVHPRATPAEVEILESTLGVPAHRSTANFGIPLVGACLVANSRGILAGDLTTPVEMVHLQEGLKVYS